MKNTFLRSMLRAVLPLLILVSIMQSSASAQSVNARPNRIVGVWVTQVTLHNCNTDVPIGNFRGMSKFELGGTAQVVPATNPAGLSAHMGIWSYLQENRYKLSFKMFRFDTAGKNIGWQIVRFDVAINEEANEIAASGQAEVFDSNGNLSSTSCPTFIGTRFE